MEGVRDRVHAVGPVGVSRGASSACRTPGRSLAALGTGRARGRELVPEGLRPRDVPPRPLLDPGRSRASARGSGGGEGARARDEVDRRALRARREPCAEAERAGAPRPLPLQRAQDADPGAECAALRAPERSAPLGEEPAAPREGRGQDHARFRAGPRSTSRRRRGGSTAGRATWRSTAHRLPARWPKRRPGCSASAGGAAAGSSTRTKSRAACAPDGRPARPLRAPPLRLRRHRSEAPLGIGCTGPVRPPTPTPPKPSASGPLPVRRQLSRNGADLPRAPGERTLRAVRENVSSGKAR